MTDVPYGVLLSGGLDSSLVAACAARFARRRVESDGRGEAWWPRLHSFAIGLEGAPDLAAARVVAQALGTSHHEFHFTVEEGLDALAEVIRHIETYDVTSVRASTPMYLMARRIKAMGVKMVLSGEGSDEIFGGYLYFHKAPSARAFHEETVRKIDALHLYDCNRANKAMAAWFSRRLFERVFPQACSALTVPGGRSIACSSPAAIAWDPAFAAAADPSGRAVAGVHVAASLPS